MRSMFLVVATLVVALWSGSARAQSNNNEAVDLIIRAARELCAEIPRTASETKIELNAKATAELQGLVKKLANLGVTTAIGLTKTDSVRALLESDMLPALTDQNKCRLHIFDKLESKLLSSTALPPTTKVFVECELLEPHKDMLWVDFDDNDRSYIQKENIRIPTTRESPWGPGRKRTYTIDRHSSASVGWCEHVEGNRTVLCYHINRISGEIRLSEGLPHELKLVTTGTCKRYTPEPVQKKL